PLTPVPVSVHVPVSASSSASVPVPCLLSLSLSPSPSPSLPLPLPPSLPLPLPARTPPHECRSSLPARTPCPSSPLQSTERKTAADDFRHRRRSRFASRTMLGQLTLASAHAGPMPGGRCRERAFDRIAEHFEVSRMSRGDEIPVFDDGLIHPFGAGVHEVGANRWPAGHSAASHDVGLDEEASAVTDRRDRLPAFHGVSREERDL